MSDDVLIAIVSGGIPTAISGVLLALITRQRRDVRAVKSHVENDHKWPDGSPINLRDNIDANQNAVMGAIAAVASDLRGVRRDVGRLDSRDLERGREMRALADRFEKHLNDAEEAVDRIGNLEHTLDPRKDS